jgi:hypothetical protein
MPTEMKIICPYCGYDHEKELRECTDEYVSDNPYETECKCGKTIVVHTHIIYAFTANKLDKDL